MNNVILTSVLVLGLAVQSRAEHHFGDKDPFIIDLKKDITDHKTMDNFKAVVHEAQKHGEGLWLVTFAGLNSRGEKGRFKDHRWILWDHAIPSPEALTTEQKAAYSYRLAIRGDAYSPGSWRALAGLLESSFDWITDDFLVDYGESNDARQAADILGNMARMLKEGGAIHLSKKNLPYLKMATRTEGNPLYDPQTFEPSKGDFRPIQRRSISDSFDILGATEAGTPPAPGSGGTNLCETLWKQMRKKVEEILETIPKSKCLALNKIHCEVSDKSCIHSKTVYARDHKEVIDDEVDRLTSELSSGWTFPVYKKFHPKSPYIIVRKTKKKP